MAWGKKTDGELTWTQNEPSGPIRSSQQGLSSMLFDIYVNQNSRVSLHSLVAKPEIHLQSQPHVITLQRQSLRLTSELRKTSY